MHDWPDYESFPDKDVRSDDLNPTVRTKTLYPVSEDVVLEVAERKLWKPPQIGVSVRDQVPRQVPAAPKYWTLARTAVWADQCLELARSVVVSHEQRPPRFLD